MASQYGLTARSWDRSLLINAKTTLKIMPLQQAQTQVRKYVYGGGCEPRECSFYQNLPLRSLDLFSLHTERFAPNL